MSNPLKKLAGHTAIYGLSSIVGRLLNYLLVPLYTYKFTNPADYGVVSELYAWVAFLIIVLSFGMETTYFRFTQKNINEKTVFSSCLKIISIINIVFLGTIFLLHRDIASAMLFENHGEYILILGAIVSLDSFSAVPLARLRAKEKALKFSMIQLSSILVNIGLNIVFFVWFFDESNPEKGVLFILIANLISAGIKPVLLIKQFFDVSFEKNRALTKKTLIYATPLVIAGFAGIINETLDRALLKHLLVENQFSLEYAEAQVGIYSACYKLAMLVTILLQAYRYAAEPFFFSQSKNKNKNKIYAEVMSYFIGIVFLAFLLVSLNLEILKYFIQNTAYWEGLKVVPILLLANVFLGIYYNQSIWYKLSGKTKYGAYIALIGAGLTVLLNVLYVPVYGYIACAWATTIVYFSQMVLSYFLGQKHFPIPYDLKKFFFYTISALSIYWIATSISLENKPINLLINNCFVLLFAFLVYKTEKRKQLSS